MNKIPLKNKENEILLISCAKFGNEFYGSLFDNGMTVNIDLASGQCRLMGRVNPFSPINWGYTIGYGRYNDKLFLVEDSCRRVAVYCLKNGDISFIDIPGKTYAEFQFDKSLITQLGKLLFIFPSFDDELIVINMLTQKVENIIHLCPTVAYSYSEVKRDTMIGELSYPLALFSHSVRVDEEVYLFSHVLSEVLVFSLKTLQVNKKYIFERHRDWVDISYGYNFFYLLDAIGNVYRWNIDNGIELLIRSEYDKAGRYERIIPTKKRIWLLPNWEDNIYNFNLDGDQKSIYKNYPDNFCYLNTDEYRSKYGYGYEDDESYYLAPFSTGYLLKISKETGEEEWIYLHGISEMDVEHYLIGIGVNGVCIEGLNLELEEFLSYKSRGNILRYNSNLKIGGEIWNALAYQ